MQHHFSTQLFNSDNRRLVVMFRAVAKAEEASLGNLDTPFAALPQAGFCFLNSRDRLVAVAPVQVGEGMSLRCSGFKSQHDYLHHSRGAGLFLSSPSEQEPID